jgi:sigma-E processing peptidase SpoIIGA
MGALSAVGVIFLPEIPLLKLIFGGLGLIFMGMITPKGVSFHRKIKFTMAFLVFEALVGGGVSLIWNLFDKYLSHFFNSADGGALNRKMLFLSLIVLLCIGVFKMLVSFFSNIESEGSVDVEISFLDSKTTVSAFIDSGNLAKDPMDMSPVLLIKKDLAKMILPENIIELSNIDGLERGVKKRIRLIPISRGGETHVLVGVKADTVRIKRGDGFEELRVTIAIDKEGGSFGGYMALMPSAALDNAFV